MITIEALRIASESPIYWRFSTRKRLDIVKYITKNLEVIMSPLYIKMRPEDVPMPTMEEAFENYLKVLNSKDREEALNASSDNIGVYRPSTTKDSVMKQS